MQIEKTLLKDCFIIKPRVFEDDRGSFFESYNHETFKKETGLEVTFVQDNQSTSKKGTLRGFHLQKGEHAQAKLVRVVKGEVMDVVIDLRDNSETYGKTFSIILNEQNNQQLFVPKGLAHGFITLSAEAIFAYKCDNYYNKASESGIIYNDKTLNIDWHLPKEQLIISAKDKELPTFKDFSNS
ncbi:dTDP-4-dehydrorhamnose 3,5-epimerase [Mesonia aestuariivivens]|uniref:dTDP-4-dehydrorhamnose 3,5-epimerase n=1 Tax=Mesonia aestuariivivens TaxID=2796128 RepID=A0ABS6W1B6_9FLAO|nr:dTDP-4-dehydrorhamnose 3,5-epimerase [Mesonia aestuariivivens]MBW2961534.1 dTDP-4-dehydrorhamnose 3,5-epimerase [Mesonia aestuariivivens]